MSKQQIAALNARQYLSTRLLDRIIQLGLPRDLPDDLIIASSNTSTWFQVMNQKRVDSANRGDAKAAKALRRKYQFFTLKRQQILAINCNDGHFFAVSVTFDVNLPRVFKDVCVYDSLRRSTRNADAMSSSAKEYLRELQLFLAQFVFFNTKCHRLLSEKPDLARFA